MICIKIKNQQSTTTTKLENTFLERIQTMPKEEKMKVKGTVVGQERNYFLVQPDELDAVIQCTISGKLRKFNITITIGDTVEIELSAYDLTKARITKRM